MAGLTIPLVDPTFTPDGATSAIKDGTTNTNSPYAQHLPVPRDAGWWLPGQARYVTGGLSPRAAADRTSPPPPVPSTSSP